MIIYIALMIFRTMNFDESGHEVFRNVTDHDLISMKPVAERSKSRFLTPYHGRVSVGISVFHSFIEERKPRGL
jgi:hypothetical protein